LIDGRSLYYLHARVLDVAVFIRYLGLLQEKVNNKTKGGLEIPWGNMLHKRGYFLAMFGDIF
jgi:hypothetical protein